MLFRWFKHAGDRNFCLSREGNFLNKQKTKTGREKLFQPSQNFPNISSSINSRKQSPDANMGVPPFY